MNIIAFSGKARSGKTTAANAWLKHIGGRGLVVSIAHEIKKRVVHDFFPLITHEDMTGDKKRVISLGGKETTIRKVLIEYGRMFRRLDEGFWILKLWEYFTHKGHAQPETIIIDDLRYHSEAVFLKGEGARIIRIERPGIELIDDPSETELDDWEFDEKIVNNGSIELLRDHVKLLSNFTGAIAQPGAVHPISIIP